MGGGVGGEIGVWRWASLKIYNLQTYLEHIKVLQKMRPHFIFRKSLAVITINLVWLGCFWVGGQGDAKPEWGENVVVVLVLTVTEQTEIDAELFSTLFFIQPLLHTWNTAHLNMQHGNQRTKRLPAFRVHNAT